MSWPTDGLPRYVIVETLGDFSLRGGGGGRAKIPEPENRTVAILDRAFCHRAISLFRSDMLGGKSLGDNRPIALRVDEARRLAHLRCDELNAEEDAA